MEDPQEVLLRAFLVKLELKSRLRSCSSWTRRRNLVSSLLHPNSIPRHTRLKSVRRYFFTLIFPRPHQAGRGGRTQSLLVVSSSSSFDVFDDDFLRFFREVYHPQERHTSIVFLAGEPRSTSEPKESDYSVSTRRAVSFPSPWLSIPLAPSAR